MNLISERLVVLQRGKWNPLLLSSRFQRYLAITTGLILSTDCVYNPHTMPGMFWAFFTLKKKKFAWCLRKGWGYLRIAFVQLCYFCKIRPELVYHVDDFINIPDYSSFYVSIRAGFFFQKLSILINWLNTWWNVMPSHYSFALNWQFCNFSFMNMSCYKE